VYLIKLHFLKTLKMTSIASYFQNRRLIIATKHQKEAVITPLVSAAFGVNCFVDPNFDTDEFGTFTGEIERVKNPIDTLRQKCLMAMEKNKCDLGIASEGSFGMHPSIFFATADDELLILIDQKNGLEIIGRELTTETNFNGSEIKTQRELLDFAEKALFPSHGLILRTAKNDSTKIIKNIRNQKALIAAFEGLINEYGFAYIETDMRAMHNPTRMKIIARATEKLIEKVQSLCPECQTPGFGITSTKAGLPCGWCRFPTESTLSYVSVCQHCQFTSEKKYPNHKITEDPMYCPKCNP
jgi:hypothetical protein